MRKGDVDGFNYLVFLAPGWRSALSRLRFWKMFF